MKFILRLFTSFLHFYGILFEKKEILPALHHVVGQHLLLARALLLVQDQLVQTGNYVPHLYARVESIVLILMHGVRSIHYFLK